MKKFFYCASMMLCGLAMVAMSSCSSDECEMTYKWGTICASYSAAYSDGDPEEKNAVKDAEAYVEAKSVEALGKYEGNGECSSLEVAKKKAPVSAAEAAIKQFASDMEKACVNHDFGPLNLGYKIYYRVYGGGEKYESKVVEFNIRGEARNRSDKAISVKDIAASLKGGSSVSGTVTYSLSDFFEDVSDVESIRYDLAASKVYNKSTRDAYTGTPFVKVTNGEGTDIQVAYTLTSANYKDLLGNWYVLIPATVEGFGGDELDFCLKVNMSFAE